MLYVTVYDRNIGNTKQNVHELVLYDHISIALLGTGVHIYEIASYKIHNICITVWRTKVPL